MKTPTSGAVIKQSGDFKSQGFSIEVSAHAFRILSSGLYSNKIRAIIRELSCNAWDAHVAAGHEDTPFEISLPSSISPKFSIRDYGTGLSLDDLMEMYTVYFSSTKTGTNDQTGCFGLGSKSPFSYTDKFTVVDHFEGKRHFCNAIINEKGFPELVVLATTDTDEPNGLEISFEVSDYFDYGNFTREAKEVLRPFPPASFRINGYPTFEKDIIRPLPILEGKGWDLLGRDHGSSLIMGNVEYPVKADVEGFSSDARSVLEFGINVEFPLGSFEVTPSREMVQWSDFSLKNVNSRLEDIYEEVVKVLSESLVGCNSRWDAMIKRNELRSSYSKFNIANSVWHGQELPQFVEVLDPALGIRQVGRDYASARNRPYKNTNYKATVRTPDKVAPWNVTKIFLDDGADAQARVSYAVATSRVSPVCLFISTDNNKQYKKALKVLGINSSHLTMASTLPAVPVAEKKTKKKYKAISKSKVFSLVDSCSKRSKDNWKEISIDFDAPVGQGLYTEVRRWKIPAEKDSSYSALSTLQALKALKLVPEDTPLIGVRTSSIAKFQASSKWQTLEEFVPGAVKKLILSDKELFLSYDFWQGEVSSEFERDEALAFVRTYNPIKDSLDSSSYLHKVGKLITRFQAQRLRTNSLRVLLRVCSSESSFSIVTRRFPEGRYRYSYRTSLEEKMKDCLYMKKVFKNYPLLRELSQSYHDTDPETLVEYIQAMDYYHSRNK